MKAGGSSGDWINWNFHIPASEVEIGSWDEIPPTNWMPVSTQVSYKLAMESWAWISHTFRKLGNQISIKPIGYKFDHTPSNEDSSKEASLLQTNTTETTNKTKQNGPISLAQKSSRKRKDEPLEMRRNATLFIEVENHGTAAQIHDDEMLIISNVKYEVQPERTNTRYEPSDFMFQAREVQDYNSLVQLGKNPHTDRSRSQHYYLNGMKPRSKKIIEVPIALEDPTNQEGFYSNYRGHLETNIKYKEFFATGHKYKN